MKQAGFSLMEMLLVLALLAVLAAVAMPVTKRQYGETALLATAHELASVMRAARGVAIRDNAGRTLILDSAGRRFLVDGVAPTRPIAASIEVQVSAPSQGIRFFADGSATGGSVAFTDGPHTAIVELDALTGHARVIRRR